MVERVIYDIGDKVKARDGRIGVVIDTKKVSNNTEFQDYQTILVRFPDRSTLEGMSDDFMAVSDRPFSRVH